MRREIAKHVQINARPFFHHVGCVVDSKRKTQARNINAKNEEKLKKSPTS
jgi:hypothetical protein